MPGNTERKAAKLLFWCISPFLFAVFGRLFFILFRFVYGSILRLLLGPDVTPVLFWTATGTSIVFTVGTVVWLYRQYKIHILEE